MINVKGIPIKIRTYLEIQNKRRATFFVMDRIAINQTTEKNPRDESRVGFDGGGSVRSSLVYHDAVHILKLSQERNENAATHCDIDGNVLSGSNVDENGGLCLGEDYSFFTHKAIDLLLNSRGNTDYPWRGDYLTVKPIKEYKTTTVSNWPIYNCQRNVEIPQWIKDQNKR